MTAPRHNVIGDAERLARFILFRRHVRADGSVKPDAFMPPPNLELSVTRRGDASGHDLWERGAAVAEQRQRTLVGRADIDAVAVRARPPLDVVPAPLPEDPGHAHIVGWPPPAEKGQQKMLAIDLAAAAEFLPAPPPTGR